MRVFKLGYIAALLCGSAYAAPLEVVSSFSILGDITQQLGGERVRVSNLVGADADAHAYHLTGRDAQRISKAKLVVLNGLGLEKADIMRAIQQNKVAFVEASKGITPLKNSEEHHHHHHGDGHDHDHGEFDPHVWHDPVLMQKYAANISAALVKIDPAGKAYYQQRLQNYSTQLAELDRYAKQQFNAIARSHRKVLTGHHSFAYMGQRYGITFIAPQGVSTESEASARTVAAIIRQIKQQGLKAVFTENIKDGRLIERIARETGVKVDGRLYSDALSKGKPAATYADLFRHNVRMMSEAMKK